MNILGRRATNTQVRNDQIIQRREASYSGIAGGALRRRTDVYIQDGKRFLNAYNIQIEIDTFNPHNVVPECRLHDELEFPYFMSILRSILYKDKGVMSSMSGSTTVADISSVIGKYSATFPKDSSITFDKWIKGGMPLSFWVEHLKNDHSNHTIDDLTVANGIYMVLTAAGYAAVSDPDYKETFISKAKAKDSDWIRSELKIAFQRSEHNVQSVIMSLMNSMITRLENVISSNMNWFNSNHKIQVETLYDKIITMKKDEANNERRGSSDEDSGVATVSDDNPHELSDIFEDLHIDDSLAEIEGKVNYIRTNGGSNKYKSLMGSLTSELYDRVKSDYTRAQSINLQYRKSFLNIFDGCSYCSTLIGLTSIPDQIAKENNRIINLIVWRITKTEAENFNSSNIEQMIESLKIFYCFGLVQKYFSNVYGLLTKQTSTTQSVTPQTITINYGKHKDAKFNTVSSYTGSRNVKPIFPAAIVERIINNCINSKFDAQAFPSCTKFNGGGKSGITITADTTSMEVRRRYNVLCRELFRSSEYLLQQGVKTISLIVTDPSNITKAQFEMRMPLSTYSNVILGSSINVEIKREYLFLSTVRNFYTLVMNDKIDIESVGLPSSFKVMYSVNGTMVDNTKAMSTVKMFFSEKIKAAKINGIIVDFFVNSSTIVFRVDKSVEKEVAPYLETMMKQLPDWVSDLISYIASSTSRIYTGIQLSIVIYLTMFHGLNVFIHAPINVSVSPNSSSSGVTNDFSLNSKLKTNFNFTVDSEGKISNKVIPRIIHELAQK